MNSGYHNRNKKDRRDSPSSSSRPRSNSKNYENNQRNRTPPKNINGKMPSVANSPSSDQPLTDGMAGLTLENIRYPIGSKISAKLVNGTVTKGEVAAFDPNFKIVIIKSAGSRLGHHNVSILNLTNCAEIKVEEEGKESPGEMQALNTQRLQERLRASIEKKKKLITAFKVGISPEGQKLFQTINKTLDDVNWNGDKILVMNKIVIEPPYRAESVRVKPGLKEDESTVKNLNHIRKIVEKHMTEMEPSKTASTESPSTVSSSRTSSVSNPGTTVNTPTTTIPNLPQASAPPTKSGQTSGGNQTRTNRNNPGRGKHDHGQPKPMYN